MTRYFLDTSALIKRYVREPGHTWVKALCRPSSGNDLYLAEIALVEVVASFSRMARESPPRLSLLERDGLVRSFRRHARRGYNIVPVDRAIMNMAADRCLAHPLRAYDAVQLACALRARDDATAIGVTPPIFVCADNTLLAAAAAEGLAGENPHAHP